jgi:hypothetical protein
MLNQINALSMMVREGIDRILVKGYHSVAESDEMCSKTTFHVAAEGCDFSNTVVYNKPESEKEIDLNYQSEELDPISLEPLGENTVRIYILLLIIFSLNFCSI